MVRDSVHHGFYSEASSYGSLVGIIREADGRYGCYYAHAAFITDAEGAREHLRADYAEAYWPALECDGWVFVYRNIFSDAPPLSPDAQFTLLRNASCHLAQMHGTPLTYRRIDASYRQKYGYVFTTPEHHEVAVGYGNIKRWAPTFREARKLIVRAHFTPDCVPDIHVHQADGKLIAHFAAR